ncbi:MAG: hypothetical protein WC009_08395 [Methylotenera sp.]
MNQLHQYSNLETPEVLLPLNPSPLLLLGLSLAVFFELVGSEGFLVVYLTLNTGG